MKAINPFQDARPSLSPNPEGVLSGDDEDSDMAQAPTTAQQQASPQPTNSISLNNSNTPPVQGNLGTGNNGSSAVWGSPGSESRGDSPILVNVISQGAPIAISAGGDGGVDGDLGMIGGDAVGIEGETVGGKRKR
jgi:hypothetical protein